MTRWSLFLQTLSLLHHFLGLYWTGAASLKVYGAKTCGDTKRARQFLDEHDIPYSWFDVDEDREALSLIKSVNNGNRTTPTIFFEDGSIEFEPSNEALARKLGVSN